jgi:hypothetical protein
LNRKGRKERKGRPREIAAKAEAKQQRSAMQSACCAVIYFILFFAIFASFAVPLPLRPVTAAR